MRQLPRSTHEDRQRWGASGNCEYVRNTYGVPAEIGRRVIVSGRPGIIAEDRGHYIGVNLDEHKPGRVENYHPTEGVVYGDMGKVRPVTAGQRKYKDYLESDTDMTFGEWVKWRSKLRKESKEDVASHCAELGE